MRILLGGTPIEQVFEQQLGLDVLTDASLLLTGEREPKRFLLSAAQLCVDRFAPFFAAYLGPSPIPLAFATRPGVPVLTTTEASGIEAAALAAGFRGVHREPLLSGERQIGELLWGLDRGRVLDEAQYEIAHALAAIVAAGFTHATAFTAQHRVADRLQRALLPTTLARRDDLYFDSSYRPATDESVVGGDWYDAFEIGDGRIGISIGDVAGHGLDAAVAMGEARRAIRVAASSAPGPAELLNYVNGVLSLEDGAGMATAIAGFLDPRTHVLCYASAGHPPPIYLGPRHRPQTLPGGGLPLGLSDEIASPNWTVTIEPGASLFLYTDGLLEYGRDILAGERLLRAALRQLPISLGRNTAADLHDAIFAKVENTDDVATLVLHSTRRSGGDFTCVYSASPEFVALARAALQQHPIIGGLNEQRAFDVLTTIGEALANAVEHGSHEPNSVFSINAAKHAGTLDVVVESAGRWKPAVQAEDRGRGIPIMQTLASSVSIATDRDRTAVHLTFRL